jgi:predicted phosphodiesterase
MAGEPGRAGGRWGIVSDVHGNRPALEAALAIFRHAGAERIAVLGDSLGRGDADGCIELARHVAEVAVVGNRDLDWRERVGPTSAEYVLGLPRLVRVGDLVFTHGDPRLTRDLSSTEIRAGFPRARAWLAAHGCRIWLFGHTHHARIWRLGGPDREPSLRFDVVRDALPARISLGDLEESALWALNVGSVGLPFPGKGPASAAIYDAEARTVELFPVECRSRISAAFS